MKIKKLLLTCVISSLAFVANAEITVDSEHVEKAKMLKDMSKQERQAYIESLTEKKQPMRKKIAVESEELEEIKAKPAILKEDVLEEQKIETMDDFEMPSMQ